MLDYPVNMEGQTGVEITALVLEPETKKKLFRLRNNYIKSGEENFTLGDVVTKAVNCLMSFEELSEKTQKEKADGSRFGAFTAERPAGGGASGLSADKVVSSESSPRSAGARGSDGAKRP